MAVGLAEVDRKKIYEPVRETRVEKPVVQKPIEPASTSKLGEKKFEADTLKFNLGNKLPADAQTNPAAPKPLSPYEAVDKIKKLPAPPLNDQVPTRNYQQQRADIADTALKTATPPTRDQFKGLPPKLASMEYQDSLNSYNNSVSELKNISTVANADLKAQPTAVLDDSAKRVWDAGKTNPQSGAAALAKEVNDLNAKYGADAGGQLVGKLYHDSKDGNYDHNLSNVFSFAGGSETGQAGLPEAQRNAVGTAIGQAYDKMSSEDRTAFVGDLAAATTIDGFRGNVLGGDSTRIADLVSRSGSAALKNDTVSALTKQMTDVEGGLLGNNNGVDIKALGNSAALIAGSGATSGERAVMFNTIIKGFPEMKDGQFKSLMNDPTFAKNMSQLFIKDSDAILGGLLTKTGLFNSPESKDGLRQFFEMGMFSSGAGEFRKEVMGNTIKLISKYADPTAPPTGGMDKDANMRTAGGLVALVQGAAVSQKDAIAADKESREETIEMIVGTAFAFAPGASKVLGEKSSELLQTAYDEATDKASSLVESGIGDLAAQLNDAESLENIKETVKEIRGLNFVVTNALENYPGLTDKYIAGYTASGVDSLFDRALSE